MPSTYSINDNTVYESLRVQNVSDALNLLPDNTSKLITPKDVRDAVYSAWESSVFKQTTGSASIEYIGIDRDDIRQKILIGKKKIGGLDVLNSTLLNYSFSDTDVYFFNNKPGVTPSNTKISFLAGTNSSLYPLAPYFDSYSSTYSTIDFDIVNNTGDIIIDSLTGQVSINNVIFPTKLQTASASNNQILKYYNGALIWGDNTINLATIGSTSSITNIYGSTVLINGFNMELSNSNPIIATFGHIKTGQTFSNAPIVEVVRQMLYPYLAPECSLFLNVGSGYTTSAIAEYGSLLPSSITMSWTVIKKSDNIISATLSNSTGFSITLPITTPGLTSVSSPPYATGNLPSTYSLTYNLSATDTGTSSYNLTNKALATGSTTQTTFTASAKLDLVYPYFWGVNSLNATSSTQINSILGSLTKSVSYKSNKTVSLSGTGYIYFIYPVSSGGSVYGYLSASGGILDENGFDITNSFTYSIYTGPTSSSTSDLVSPSGFWTASYYVYKYGPLTVGTPSSVNWEFKY